MLHRRTLLTAAAAAAALALSACATNGLPRRGELRVATFNIWHDKEDWAARLPLLVEALRSADADVIALQEVLEDAAKSLPNQAETIAAALGGYSVHFVSPDPAGSPRRYGNALLTRLPVLDETSKKLEPLNDYRTALRLRVNSAGRPVDFVVTHLAWQDHEGPVRARQIGDLLSWLPRDGVPLVVMGDFNAPLADSGLVPLAAAGLVPARLPASVLTTLNTAKGHKPRVIDHIFAEPSRFAIGEARLIGDQPSAGVHPSDHFGVAAALRLR